MSHQLSATTRLGLGGVAFLLAVAGPTLPATALAADTARTPMAATVEEQRLDRAAPQEILRRSAFDAFAPRFERALRGSRSYAQVERTVTRHGSELWRRAVDRAQGRGPVTGDLSRGDDRPLYWARLALSRELREWEPRFGLNDEQRRALHAALETSSRGQGDIRYPGHPMKRVLVTGFDPFTLDTDTRTGNPSGAGALALDGTLVQTAEGPARIETVVFPVRWADFADGAVERALAPHLPHLDLFTTVSQGRQGRFDVERTNGAWRGGFPDNENVASTGLVPVTDPDSQPQWTSTTLPYGQLTEADTGRFPVYDNTGVTEIPAGGTQPVTRPDGPTPGSAARAGGGGNYLSNEIAYRATLLRDRLGLSKLSGGHLHTPVLQFGAENTNPQTGRVTDPDFERNRSDIVRQVRELVKTAVNTAD
ncbi:MULTISPECIES: C15 family peptidase [Streptomyces]|uniref:pyroglutamyl peptidase n=1 Tax=Streptomyces TaxID=1883 RepID=UPI000CD4A53B|nr:MULTISPECIES: pyroglutamyl peptidase [Streptomyces]MCX4713034.1 pyroglutamyl-peptidase I [Streptomyces griseus]QXR00658.1 pyroglutamyl-peptidase I [Streptomyces sp. WY228]